MKTYYESTDKHCKSIFGTIEQGQKFDLRLFCVDGIFIHNIQVQFISDDDNSVMSFDMHYESTNNGESAFSTTVKIDKVGLYWYKFVINTEKGLFIKNKAGEDYQLTIYQKGYDTPQDFKGGVIYHIFVDRFNKGKDKACKWIKNGHLKEWSQPLTIVDDDGVYRANDFYGGNLQGIVDKLDYLSDLGVTTIYLSPIFKSSSNHRYDTGDYNQIDELLGDEKSFVNLAKKAKEKNINIMLDGVFNHTGADSLYFNKFNNYNSIGAYQSQNSPYSDWYTFYNFPDDYHCWWGVTVCPTVRKNVKGFNKLLLADDGVVAKWIKLGAKAWRLDVVDELDEQLVRGIRKSIKKADKNALLIGEVWEDASNKISYGYRRHYLQGKELDGVMNYPFKQAILDYSMGGMAENFAVDIMRIVENYPHFALLTTMTMISSHDTVRALSLLSGIDTSHLTKKDKQDISLNHQQYSIAKQRLMMASCLEYILPGIPSIYYGDEIGMQGFDDPLNRKPMTWDSIDNDLLNHYKKLGKIRKQYKSALCGQTRCYGQGNILTIERSCKENKLIMIANNSEHIVDYYIGSDVVNLFNSEAINKGWITIKPNSFIIMASIFNEEVKG